MPMPPAAAALSSTCLAGAGWPRSRTGTWLGWVGRLAVTGLAAWATVSVIRSVLKRDAGAIGASEARALAASDARDLIRMDSDKG
jgi:hypothetical protein